MGDGKKGDLRVDFDRRVKLTFLDIQVTTDAGLLAYRELDAVPGLTDMADDFLCDSRLGSSKQHQLRALLRQSIYSGWPATKTSTMPSGWRSILPCIFWWVAGRANQRSGQLR